MKFTDITLADVSVEAKVETLGVVLDNKLSEIDAQVSTVSKLVGPQGPQGEKGDKGAQGPQGIAGKDGKDGRDGKDGKDGKDGDDGKAGVSVVGASVALDGSLVLELSNGSQIDAGDVVGPAGPGGMNGAQGPMGLQGPQGEQGIQGPTGATGATGPQGEQGIQGIQGVAGPTGPQGIQGVKGDTGDTGATGAPGTSVNIKGEVATVGALPSSGNVIGDAYIVTADGNLYTWTGSAWLDVGQIVGPQGATGPQGPQGIQGVKGDTGDTGPQGIQGIQGVKGDTGDTGPAGAAGVGVPVGGTTGQVLAKIDATNYNTQWITPNAGTVTSVTGTAPVVSSGGATPAISMAKATSLVDGYLSATDWTTFNSKQPAGTYATGTGTASGTNTGDETNATIKTKLGAATSLVDGYLTSTDWSTFNGKQAALVSGTNIKTVNGNTLLGSGDLTVSASAGGATTQVQYNNAGALAGSANFIHDGTNVGIGTTPDGTSWLQIAGGTTTKASLELIAGTLMTTPDDGSIEYDGGIFYGTPNANNRGVMLTENFVARTGTKTMTSNTSLQSVFGGGTGGLTNGALSVQGTETYFFECSLNLSSMSATSGNMGFSIVGAGTATFTSAAWHAFGFDSTTQTTAAAAGTSFSASQAATGNIVTAATGTAVSVYIKGIFRTNGAGTIIPSVQLTTAAAAVIGNNCWFKCYPVGSNTVVSVGNWS